MDFYDVVVLVAFVAFMTVAFILLWPVYRFLKREEETSELWTEEQVRRRMEGPPERKAEAQQLRDGQAQE